VEHERFGAWDEAFREFGVVPTQSATWISAEASRAGVARPRIVEAGGLLSAFRTDGELGICLVEGVGCLQTGHQVDVAEFVRASVTDLNVGSLCFPLLYDESAVPRSLGALPAASCMERRPSPLIDWSDHGAGLWARCEDRLGSRAASRRRGFEESGATCAWIDGQAADDVVADIERKSWKSAAGLDMHSRGQFGLYAELVLRDFVKVRVATVEGDAIAYRLDCLVADVLFCLKWSFDDGFRHLSPGFAMLALDLARSHSSSIVRVIDLYGAPDTLKSLLATGERRRSDVYWPPSVATEKMLLERTAHDGVGILAHESGVGLRSLYAED